MKKVTPRLSTAISGPPRLEIRLPGKAKVVMAFRLIPAGSFRMGSRGFHPSEEPIHEVRIKDPFWMAETPVTQAQFAVWTETEGIDHKNHFHDPPRPENPAENLDWMQANAFCEWLSREIPKNPENELPQGFSVFSLPSEAQWEYACRAGTETEYCNGDGEAVLMNVAWFGEEWESGFTHPVLQKDPNKFQLSDMHGNVWEWCRDVYDPLAYRKREDPWSAREWTLEDAGGDATHEWVPIKPGQAPDRVVRGGSWFDAGDAWSSRCRSHWSRSRHRFGPRILFSRSGTA